MATPPISTESRPPENFSTAFPTLADGLRQGAFHRKLPEVGKRIHHYEIIGYAGEGGFSSVYEARHIYLDRKVALKTLKQGGPIEDVTERYLREARALAALHHRCVVRIQDANIFEGFPYVVTEYLAGMTLQQAVARDGKLPISRAMDLMEEIGGVLAMQANLGIVHRDIKPGNIFIRSNGQFCLFDYGLVGQDQSTQKASKITDDRFKTNEGQLFGTPMFMSPEQFRTSFVDIRSDLYSLGMTAWSCLAGRDPRDYNSGQTFDSLREQATHELPSVREFRHEVPDGLDRILQGLTAADPFKRYQSPRRFLEDLEVLRYGNRPPLGPTRGSVFVAMPFPRRFDRVYEAIVEACSQVRLAGCRVDRMLFVDNIWGQIVHEIEHCLVVIADFTIPFPRMTPSPNVVTEAAHARAIGKPLIIISQSAANRIPFDWHHVSVIKYRNTTRGLRYLRSELCDRFRHRLREMDDAETE
jgi:hypothetical protein